MNQEQRSEIEARAPRSGVVGIIDGLRSIVGGAGGDPLDEDEALCLSSAAFKNYVYEPRYNPPGTCERAFALHAENTSNYGAIEAYGGATGWEVREFNFINTRDFLAIVEQELAGGRAALTLAIEAPEEPQLIVGLRRARSGARALKLLDRGADRARSIVIDGNAPLQRPEHLGNWCVVARPAERPPWALSRAAQRVNVLRWAARHARNTKEFFHETRANYAPGLSGFAALIRLLEDDAQLWDDALARYLRAHLEGLYIGRGAAASALPRWADAMAEEGGEEVSARDQWPEAIRSAATAWRASAEAIGSAPWRDLIEASEPERLDRRGAILTAYRSAAAHEAQAAAALLPLLHM